jgi:hypothetical protein
MQMAQLLGQGSGRILGDLQWGSARWPLRSLKVRLTVHRNKYKESTSDSMSFAWCAGREGSQEKVAPVLLFYYCRTWPTCGGVDGPWTIASTSSRLWNTRDPGWEGFRQALAEHPSREPIVCVDDAPTHAANVSRQGSVSDYSAFVLRYAGYRSTLWKKWLQH